jgi:uncharacterized cupredoxin-like copper-binding protein
VLTRLRVCVFSVVLSALVAALVATACGSPSNSEPPVAARDAFTMRVDNTMHFASPNIAVQAGQPLELTLENTGTMPHDLSLSDGVAQPIKIEAAGGESEHATLVITQPGTYQFVCSQPGHALAGMRGTIVAQ